MNQEPRIMQLASKKLIGLSTEMSRLNDNTPELWQGFMRRRDELANRATQDYVSMQIFPAGPEQLADPAASFTKWAAVEVRNFQTVPEGMATYTLQAGRYAVFIHNGPATDLSTFIYIFSVWLPNSSAYELDDREHFEVLPRHYSALDPNATEEIWIPVRERD